MQMPNPDPDFGRKLKALLEAEPPPPPDLEAEVMTTLDTLGLVGDFMELFGSRFTGTHSRLVDPDQPVGGGEA